jgi:hypothetical protein
MYAVNADVATALVPVRAWIQPLYAVSQQRMMPYRGNERPQGEMRFLGYRLPRETVFYGPSGRALQDGSQGNLVDLYV